MMMVEDLCLAEGALEGGVVHAFLLEDLAGGQHAASVSGRGLEVALVAHLSHRQGQLGPGLPELGNPARVRGNYSGSDFVREEGREVGLAGLVVDGGRALGWLLPHQGLYLFQLGFELIAFLCLFLDHFEEFVVFIPQERNFVSEVIIVTYFKHFALAYEFLAELHPNPCQVFRHEIEQLGQGFIPL